MPNRKARRKTTKASKQRKKTGGGAGNRAGGNQAKFMPNSLLPMRPKTSPTNGLVTSLKSGMSMRDALHFAVKEYVEGDRDYSIALFREILKVDPNQPEALFRMGVARGRKGDWVESMLLLKRAYALAPDQYKLLRNYAIALQRMNLFEQAMDVQRRALMHEKMDKRVLLHDLANGYAALNKFIEAQEYYDQVIELDPDNVLLHYNRAVNLQQIGANDIAAESYQRALEIDPNYEPALLNLASSYQHMDREDEAGILLKNYIAYMEQENITSEENGPYYALLRYHHRLQEFDEAGRILEKIGEFEAPDYTSDYWMIKAELISKTGDFNKAIEICEQVRMEEPDHTKAYSDGADYLLQLGREAEAISLLNEMRIACSKDEQAEHIWGIAQLQFGNLKDGFAAYEHRYDREDMVSNAGRFRHFIPHPYLTNKQDAIGKRVVIYLEQGIGDIIQFSRYLPLLKQYAKKVILIYGMDSKPFKRLITAMNCVDEQYDKFLDLPGLLDGFDTHCALMSLPHIFETTLETIPPPVPFPIPPEVVAQWQTRLGTRTKPRIGLVVSGNKSQGNDSNRSASLELFQDLISDRAETLLVQRDLRPHDVELAQKLGLWHIGKEFDDLMDTAAVYQSLDLMIGVETGIMHLAATQGTKVWKLLTTLPDWRYFRVRSDSPFYDSVTLFRQENYGDWRELAGRTRIALDQYLGSIS